ncbi:hypothetical protein [Desulfonema ishimotonii]|nr:hypothetical protein [Desulfonema ishimotonii]
MTAYAGQITLESHAFGVEKINGKKIFVITPDNDEALWFVISEESVIQIRNTPPTMHHVDVIRASPDEKYLAVSSVGEGHPVIHVLSLPDLLADQEDAVLYAINPYPGNAGIVGWKGNHLHIESDILLTHGTGEEAYLSEALTLFSYESFLLDMKTGKLEPVSEMLKNPVEYYGNHLLLTPDSYSPAAELDALRVLNDVSAIPYLEKTLKSERYLKHRKDIKALLLKLKKTVSGK